MSIPAPETVISVLRSILPPGFVIVQEGQEPQSAPMEEEEAAAYLKTTVHVLRRHHTNGTGPLFRKIGRDKIYLRQDLDAWLEAQQAYRSPTEYRATG